MSNPVVRTFPDAESVSRAAAEELVHCAAEATQARRIGVSVCDGAVTLSGTAASYGAKYAAERAALRVPGVRAVSEGARVAAPHERGDEEIARAVAHALEQAPGVPAGVKATVEGGWVTLRGEALSTGQRDAALDAVRQRAGMERVYDLITVKPAG
jgi:osmotically-inducible protein OsmY